MKEDILKIIWDYSSKNYSLDENAIEKIADIVIKDKSLEEYVKKISINTRDSDNTTIARYSLLYREIIININY